MKIYTKGGDKGETSLLGGKRVPKNHPRLSAYGTLDELNAWLGVVLPLVPDSQRETVVRVQSDLFRLGAELAADGDHPASFSLVTSEEPAFLEKQIDEMERELTRLKNFILPGGSEAARFLHLARTVCRRAERAIAVVKAEEGLRDEVIVYVNRLSDYLFVCARFANSQAGIEDRPWLVPKN